VKVVVIIQQNPFLALHPHPGKYSLPRTQASGAALNQHHSYHRGHGNDLTGINCLVHSNILIYK
jgi:hypothetical protein